VISTAWNALVLVDAVLDLQREPNHAVVEVAWNESMDAVDTLLQVLP
jgi:hypothetical protein